MYLSDFLPQVIALGGSAAAFAYFIFRTTATKWIESKFSERLELLRQAHDREVRAIGLKIDGILDRTKRLHEKEFEVLPKAWDLLNEAFYSVLVTVSPNQRYLDLAGESPEAMTEILATTTLTPSQVIRVTKAVDPTAELQALLDRHRLANSEASRQDAFAFLLKTGIFIEPSLRTDLRRCHDVAWEALTEHRRNVEGSLVPRENVARQRMVDYLEREMPLLEARVYDRLQPVCAV